MSAVDVWYGADIVLSGAVVLDVLLEGARSGVSSVIRGETSATSCVSVMWRDGLLRSCSGGREVVRRIVSSCSYGGVNVCGMFCVSVVMGH